jgi:hypothetical protein
VHKQPSLCAAFLMAAVGGLGLLAPTPASADVCSVPGFQDMGDNFAMWDPSGWQCNQAFIDYWWDAFDMETADWDWGFGYENPCNSGLPLGKTFNSLYTLGYASTGAPHCDTSRINKTEWSMCWAANNICKLAGACGDGDPNGSPAATTHLSQNHVRQCWTQLKWPFFFGSDVVRRAATVFHEARHSGGGGCGHNGGTGCLRRSSCDKTWTNGCEENANRDGANKAQITWLESYVWFGWRTTPDLRSSGVARANDILQRGFNTPPCMYMHSSGLLISC